MTRQQSEIESLAVQDRRLKLKEVSSVIGIVACFFILIAGKLLDALNAVPPGHGPEMAYLILFSSPHLTGKVSRCPPIARNSSLKDIVEIRFGMLDVRFAMPNASDD
jgi:hypothetical protein